MGLLPAVHFRLAARPLPAACLPLAVHPPLAVKGATFLRQSAARLARSHRCLWAPSRAVLLASVVTCC